MKTNSNKQSKCIPERRRVCEHSDTENANFTSHLSPFYISLVHMKSYILMALSCFTIFLYLLSGSKGLSIFVSLLLSSCQRYPPLLAVLIQNPLTGCSKDVDVRESWSITIALCKNVYCNINPYATAILASRLVSYTRRAIIIVKALLIVAPIDSIQSVHCKI